MDSSAYPDNDNKSKKRLPRSQKKRIKKEQRRQKRKLSRNEKKRRRKAVIRSERESFLSSMNPDERDSYISYLKVSNYEKSVELENFLNDSYLNGVPVCIDCSFENLMDLKEIRSLAKQISLCYSIIKKNMIPIKLVLTSFDNSSKLFEECNLFGFNKWKVNVYNVGFWEIFDIKNVVLLTPDANEYLEDVTRDKVYVIGGLVDTHVKKVLKHGEHHGVLCKAIPIKKYYPECKKTVLNVSTVFEILSFRINNVSWEEALSKCLPSRSSNLAYLYCSNAPPTIDDSDDNEKNEDYKKLDNEDNNIIEDNEHGDNGAIRGHPGDKSSYCFYCKGKTFLNKESEEKHLKSRNHLKNVKKFKKNKEFGLKVKRQFLKRMDLVDKINVKIDK